MSGPESVGEILCGDGSNNGYRHTTSEGAPYTVGPTEDPRYPGGTYVSATDVSGNKMTVVLDLSGRIVKKS